MSGEKSIIKNSREYIRKEWKKGVTNEKNGMVQIQNKTKRLKRT